MMYTLHIYLAGAVTFRGINLASYSFATKTRRCYAHLQVVFPSLALKTLRDAKCIKCKQTSDFPVGREDENKTVD